MAFNGTGTFLLDFDWNNDAANGIPITASRVQSEDQNIANGLSMCMTTDGQSVVTGNIPMNNFKHTGAGAATTAGDYIVYGQNNASVQSFLASNLFCNTTAWTVGLSDLSSAMVMSGTGSGSNFIHFYHNTNIVAQVAPNGSFLVNTQTPGGWGGNASFESVSSGGNNAVSGYALGTGSGLISRVDSTSANLAFFVYGISTPVNVGSITTNGSTTTYGTTSDLRLKQDIIDAPEQGSILDEMRVRHYAFKANPSLQQTGFIAQELNSVFPDAVVPGDDGEEVERVWQVDLAKIVPLLVKEIQNLRTRIAVLEAK